MPLLPIKYAYEVLARDAFWDGYAEGLKQASKGVTGVRGTAGEFPKPRRKLSDWQKFIKANSSKKKFKFANGKLKLKSMGIAYRKTAVYKRNKKK